jgi:hypothetical protein
MRYARTEALFLPTEDNSASFLDTVSLSVVIYEARFFWWYFFGTNQLLVAEN